MIRLYLLMRRKEPLVVDEKSGFLSEEERVEIAEAVESFDSICRLSQNPQTDVTFEWNKILSLEGTQLHSLMYSYARAKAFSVKRRERSPSRGVANHRWSGKRPFY